jgi:hypothetical protein
MGVARERACGIFRGSVHEEGFEEHFVFDLGLVSPREHDATQRCL